MATDQKEVYMIRLNEKFLNALVFFVILSTAVLVGMPGIGLGEETQEEDDSTKVSFWNSYSTGDFLGMYRDEINGPKPYKLVFEKLNNSKVSTPEKAIQIANANKTLDPKEAASVVGLVRVADNYIWAVRYVNPAGDTLDEFWISSTSGVCISVFKTNERVNRTAISSIEAMLLCPMEEMAREIEKKYVLSEYQTNLKGHISLLEQMTKVTNRNSVPSITDHHLEDLKTHMIDPDRDYLYRFLFMENGQQKEPPTSTYRDLFKQLTKSKISTRKMARVVAFQSRKRVVLIKSIVGGGELQKEGQDANERITIIGLIRLGRKVPGFAEKGDFVWIARNIHTFLGTADEIWISSTTGASISVLDTMPMVVK